MGYSPWGHKSWSNFDITLSADGWKTDDPDFDINNPYEGRDPRFARSILANGMLLQDTPIETYVGGADYSATRADLGTPTGYYLRKYIQELTDFTPEAEYSCQHSWIVPPPSSSGPPSPPMR